MKKDEGALCNLCGESCAMHLYDDEYENEGLIRATVVGGYPSTPGNGDGALDDMTRYTFSICEFCLDFLFQHAVIPPKVEDVGMPPVVDSPIAESDLVCEREMVFVHAAERVARDEWRTMKRDFYAEQGCRAALRKIGRKP